MKKKQRRIAVSTAFLVTLLVVLIIVFYIPWASILEKRKNVSKLPETETQTQIMETEQTETQETETVEEPVIPEITLVMVGDMLMHTRVMNSGLSEDGSYNFDHLFRYTGDQLRAADLAMVNQETILGGTELGISSYPCFNSPYEVATAEVEAGFDVILQATNHALDKGKQGLINDMTMWGTTYPGIAVLGINDSQEKQDNYIYLYEKDGITLSVLNYTYGTNGIPLPSDMPYAVNLLSEDKIAADIAKAKELSDFVIVAPHWGTEYRLSKDSNQEYWSNFFLEQGVDLVIGTHPHVIEPIETLTREDGHQMLVYYSIGNYVNGTESYDGSPADRMVGGMATVTIGYNDNGQVAVKEYGVEPLVCHLATGTDYSVYYLKDYTEELASQNLILAQDSDFSLQYCKDLVSQVWPDITY